MDKAIEALKLQIGYKGCRNCVNQIEPMRMCEWVANNVPGFWEVVEGVGPTEDD